MDEWAIKFLNAYVKNDGCLTNTDKYGIPPIFYLFKYRTIQQLGGIDESVSSAVRFFVDHKAIDVKDGKGCTPLHKASENGLLSTADLLLKSGADPLAVDYDNKTPLQYCLENRRYFTTGRIGRV